LNLYTILVYWNGGGMDHETEATEFEWDEGNAAKNWIRHRVTQSECEEVFFNRPLVVAEDEIHSDDELRFFALGQTDAGRLLLVVYTIRSERVRVISARDMIRSERKAYERARAEELEANSEV
jgi:uncharacterized DUF497 family protein